MDRFMAQASIKKLRIALYLKSNMDRFMALTKKAIAIPSIFKIQYGQIYGNDYINYCKVIRNLKSNMDRFMAASAKRKSVGGQI